MCRPARTGYAAGRDGVVIRRSPTAAAGPETAYQASLRGRSSSMS